MNDLVSYQLEDGVAILTLDNGKVNAVSHEVIEAFHVALDRAVVDQAIVIITGTPGMFSGGYDLKVMTSGPQNAIALVAAGSGLARRMLAHPFPIIVACTGHAVAKGSFILLSADYRVGIDGPFRIGLNEVQIGMTMHHVGIELARNRLRKSYFNRSVINAEMFDPQEAVKAGFLDAVVGSRGAHAGGPGDGRADEEAEHDCAREHQGEGSQGAPRDPRLGHRGGQAPRPVGRRDGSGHTQQFRNPCDMVGFMKVGPSALLPILRSDTVGELLAQLFLHPEQGFTLTELATDLGVSLPTVAREVDRMLTAGLVVQERVGRARRVSVNRESDLFLPLQRDHLAHLRSTTGAGGTARWGRGGGGRDDLRILGRPIPG